MTLACPSLNPIGWFHCIRILYPKRLVVKVRIALEIVICITVLRTVSAVLVHYLYLLAGAFYSGYSVFINVLYCYL